MSVMRYEPWKLLNGSQRDIPAGGARNRHSQAAPAATEAHPGRSLK
jgi:hypothetical protein